MNGIVWNGITAKQHKRLPKTKHSCLPIINKRERNGQSPISITQYRKRAMSPIQTRIISPQNRMADQSLNNSNIPSPTYKYTIECTLEQSIICEKARVRVQEAKLLRFTGFKSPRALILKILDNHNIWNKSELGINNFPKEVNAPIYRKEAEDNNDWNLM